MASDLDHDVDDTTLSSSDAGLVLALPWPLWQRALAVVVALGAVGAAALVGATLAAPSLPADDSAEAGFARDMAIHHGQAVQMADIVRQQSDDEVLRALAGDIMFVQQAQKGQFVGWLDAWGLSQQSWRPVMGWMGHDPSGGMPGMASTEDLRALAAPGGPAAERDQDFIRLMIAHHRSGIDMGQAVLARTDRPEVRAFAEQMVEVQRTEIGNLELLLDGGPSAPTAAGGQMEHGR